MSTLLSEADFGDALRGWRRARGLSQLDLALAAGVSARHLSFLESSRAKPSRDMVMTLADALVLPRASRNALLNAAGYAPLYPVSPLEGDALEPLRRVLSEMMERHSPNPAILCDRRWNVHDANATARALLAPLQGARGERNMVRMLAESPAAETFIANLGEVLQEMTERIRIEALEAGADPELAVLLRLLEQRSRQFPAPATTGLRRPLVPLVLHPPGQELRFLSAITHFGTSEDVAVRDLRLELLFPVDDATRRAMAEAATTPSP